MVSLQTLLKKMLFDLLLTFIVHFDITPSPDPVALFTKPVGFIVYLRCSYVLLAYYKLSAYRLLLG